MNEELLNKYSISKESSVDFKDVDEFRFEDTNTNTTDYITKSKENGEDFENMLDSLNSSKMYDLPTSFDNFVKENGSPDYQLNLYTNDGQNSNGSIGLYDDSMIYFKDKDSNGILIDPSEKFQSYVDGMNNDWQEAFNSGIEVENVDDISINHELPNYIIGPDVTGSDPSTSFNNFDTIDSAEAYINGSDKQDLNSINLGTNTLHDLKKGMKDSSFSDESINELEASTKHGDAVMTVELSGWPTTEDDDNRVYFEDDKVNGELTIYEDGTMVYYPNESEVSDDINSEFELSEDNLEEMTYEESEEIVASDSIAKQSSTGYVVEPSKELQETVDNVENSLDIVNDGYLSEGKEDEAEDVIESSVQQNPLYISSAPWGKFSDEQGKSEYFDSMIYASRLYPDEDGNIAYQSAEVNSDENYKNIIEGLKTSDLSNEEVDPSDLEQEFYQIDFGGFGTENAHLDIYEDGSVTWQEGETGTIYNVETSSEMKDALMDFYSDNIKEISETEPEFTFPNYYQIDALEAKEEEDDMSLDISDEVENGNETTIKKSVGETIEGQYDEHGYVDVENSEFTDDDLFANAGIDDALETEDSSKSEKELSSNKNVSSRDDKVSQAEEREKEVVNLNSNVATNEIDIEK